MEGATSRTVYATAADPECRPVGARLMAAVRTEVRRHGAADLRSAAELGSLAADWSRHTAEHFRALLDDCGTDGARDTLVRRAALDCAPLALVAGAWLQGISSPAGADDPAVLRVLARYAHDVGVGQPTASRGAAYLALLRTLRLSEHAAPVPRLTIDRRIDDHCFDLAALLLTMSRLPENFRDELRGADWCLRAVGLLPPLALVKEAVPEASWYRIDLACEEVAPWPPDAFSDVRPAKGERDPHRPDGDWPDGFTDTDEQRFSAGFHWTLDALRQWSDGVYARLDAARDPARDMAELLRLRAREGAVYHHAFQLEGRSLSDWLAECRTDPVPLLGALARSRLVRPGRSAASPLVNGLTGVDGAMFRVFAPAELAVIRRWIDALPAASGEAPAARAARSPASLVLPSWEAAPDERGTAPKGLRDAYRQLQSRTDTPALSDWAARYAQRWLDRSRHGLDRDGNRLPERWPAEGLRPWLAEQHERHAAEFTAGQDVPVPSREALVESTVQLAPLTMIDGGWLLGFTDYELAASHTGFPLFETYWDELGNGQPGLNHPLIYRELVAEMGVELPPTGTAEFAAWPGFDERSFELPVYWLSVARRPRTLQPEILGLNLAMELSGVGGSYRRARLALLSHGFSTRFVDIHNTIDNVASGHAAWACDAVDAYLAAVPAGPSGSREQIWRRICIGFRSLDPGTTPVLARWAGRVRRSKAHA
ncbi:iron-containing redox enzyme family protein [Streptomyces sp. NPDC057909]|uniref:iron-containing redox enzyme family protein n=1 Tax=Streptomyces sp. NPDC057909 TaxID=3346277 RepID=UPI0036F181D5